MIINQHREINLNIDLTLNYSLLLCILIMKVHKYIFSVFLNFDRIVTIHDSAKGQSDSRFDNLAINVFDYLNLDCQDCMNQKKRIKA